MKGESFMTAYDAYVLMSEVTVASFIEAMGALIGAIFFGAITMSIYGGKKRNYRCCGFSRILGGITRFFWVIFIFTISITVISTAVLALDSLNYGTGIIDHMKEMFLSILHMIF
jgi:hypothetical protein